MYFEDVNKNKFSRGQRWEKKQQKGNVPKYLYETPEKYVWNSVVQYLERVLLVLFVVIEDFSADSSKHFI